ncbi:MAG: D-aminoacylase [Gemmatimonadetes bacterium]|nr:D-aminoacylase [Gemmatimonadota bacterium]
MPRHWAVATVLLSLAACAPRYDVVIRGGTIYDGTGADPVVGDVAIRGDTVAAVGTATGGGRVEIDATGMAVTPGFINMLSHSEETLIQDPRSQGEIRQGVTLEVFGEGSMGPLSEAMKKEALEQQGDIRYPIEWSTLGEYFDFLERRGIAPNIASFVGASTVRVHVIGYQNRAPTPAELDRMKELVAQAMDEGALGVTTALIYTPATFAKTHELIALAKVAAEAGGVYAAHIRSEANRLLEAIDETIRIASESGLPAEIYHLKAAGQANWPKMDRAIQKIDSARAAGVRITADMYTYTAGATGLDAAMPPWVQEGGLQAWIARLKNPAIRRRVAREMRTPTDQWENLYLGAGSPDQILMLGFKTDSLKPLIGKTLADVARMRGKSPEETAMDLVIQDGTRVDVAYFLMSEDNIKKQIAQPWVSFGSDAGSQAPEGPFLKSNPHPRAYGNFARLLGQYVRDERVIPLQEAIRRLTTLPAENLHLERRGSLKPGFYADVVVFDAAKIRDHATFEQPHQYATGVLHVFVNGEQVLKDGEHTGALPGRIVRGPAWKGNAER